MNTKKNILASTIAFFMGSAVQGVVAQEDVGGQEESGWALEEIVVTATKREASLQDTSMSISVLSKATIEKRGLTDMNDYLATIPGASFIDIDPTLKRVTIRGLGLGLSDRQVTSSVYLGEMPMSNALNAVDIKLVDIDQIEVLKGPQGTLYGSSALGGTIRNIPTSPNLEKLDGSVKIDVSAQDESDDNNQSLMGVINIPLIDNKMALRVTAYQYDNAGYIDIVSSPDAESVAAITGGTVILKEDSGDSTNTGARASLLWQPLESLEISLILGTQKDDINGRLDVASASGGYQANYLNHMPNQSGETDYSNLLVEYDFGWATLISSSSVVDSETEFSRNLFMASPDSFFGPAEVETAPGTSQKSQEVRIASSLSGPWQYLAGLFYEEAQIKTRLTSKWIGNTTSNPFGAEVLIDTFEDLNYNQKAIFGELSYQFNEQWILTLGGRHFEYDRTDATDYINNAPFNGLDSKEDVSQSGNTYKTNLAFTPNEDTLIYAQWSEGFRLGHGQALPNPSLCDTDNNGRLDFTDGLLTPKVTPDTTENVELGLKLSFLDNRFTVNSAVFRTDWDNLPLAITNTSSTCPASFQIRNNIGSARSQGIEFEIMYIMNNWEFSLTASYIDTQRTNTRPPLKEGERLAFAPLTNASAGLQYNFSLAAYPAFIRTDIGYVGEYETNPLSFGFPPSGDYVDAKIRFGINMGQWSLAFYGTNLTDNEDIRVDSGTPPNSLGIRAVPQRLGLELTYDF